MSGKPPACLAVPSYGLRYRPGPVLLLGNKRYFYYPHLFLFLFVRPGAVPQAPLRGISHRQTGPGGETRGGLGWVRGPKTAGTATQQNKKEV